MSIAELVSELVYAGKTMQEIAGMDYQQMRWIYFRARDKFGELIRRRDGDEPVKVTRPVSFEEMFKSAKRQANAKFKGKVVKGVLFTGFTEQDIERMWQAFLKKNPGAAGRRGGKSRPKGGSKRVRRKR